MKSLLPKVLLLVWMLCLGLEVSRADDAAVIAVASNLSHAIRDIGNTFTAQTQQQLKFSFGSSGHLALQIAKGSPHEVFLSANTHYISELQRLDKTINKAIVYARGRLCLFVPRKSGFYHTENIHTILRLIQFDHYRKIAIANPELAPYGLAAFQTLQSLGVWGFDPRKLVIGENINQATQFALTQTVDLGFIAKSHANLQAVQENGKCMTVPEHLHKPIDQSMILTQHAGTTARAFFDFMISNYAQDILIQHGYQLP